MVQECSLIGRCSGKFSSSGIPELEMGQNLVQYNLSGRFYSEPAFPVQPVCPGHRQGQMPELPSVRKEVQILLHRHCGAQDRQQPLRGMSGLSGRMPARCSPLQVPLCSKMQTGAESSGGQSAGGKGDGPKGFHPDRCTGCGDSCTGQPACESRQSFGKQRRQGR